MVKLIIEDDEGKTTVVPLIRDEITIGRKEGNTIRLTERNVSRRHAKLLKQNGAIFIEDLNSYNGIKVNGNRISGRVAIAEGDRIQIGDYVLGLKLEGVEKAGDPFQPGQTTKLPRPEAETAQIDVETARAAVEEAVTEVTSAEVKPENTGRLVCMSNNFPGQEWGLDKPIVVIGRTDDNDVVVNHRSISRHHARVTEENGRYTIVDMQSSNGVRVNGEEYGKVELRRGDLIDLGHVRLRFVAPGEDFVFARDGSVVDISKGGPSRGSIYAAVVVAALVAVTIVVWRLSKSESTTGTTDIRTSAGGDAQAAASTQDPAVLLARISQLVGSEQWAQAIEICDKLTTEARVNAEANCDKARMEKQAADHFEAVHKASLQNKYLEVIEGHAKIPEQSVYKKRDLHVLQNAKAKYLAQAMKSLEEAIQAKDCEQARTIAQKIKEVEPIDTEAEQKVSTCGAVAVGPRPKVRPPRPPRPKVRPPVIPPVNNQPSLNTLQQAKTMLKDAQKAYVNGNHQHAAKLAQKVLALQPGNLIAAQILGASACYLKNQALAMSAYNRLPASRRGMLKNMCQRNGINLP